MTDNPREIEGCFGNEGEVGGVTSTSHNALCSAPPCTHVNAWSAPRYEKNSDDDNYQPGFRAQSHYGIREHGLAHPDVARECHELLFRRDWYEAPARPVPAPLPRQEEFGVPRQPALGLGPARPYSQMRLAQMQDFQGDGSVTLDMFSDELDSGYSGFSTGTFKRPVVRPELI